MGGREKILVLQNEVEARLLTSVLKEHGIPHFLMRVAARHSLALQVLAHRKQAMEGETEGIHGVQGCAEPNGPKGFMEGEAVPSRLLVWNYHPGA